MKIIINQSSDIAETVITVNCRDTSGIEDIIAALGMTVRRLAGRKDGEIVFVPLDEVLRLESVDGRAFFYTAAELFEFEGTLSELERGLADTMITRISRSALVNLRHVKSIRATGYSKLAATLDNGEVVVVSRMYMPEIKRRLGI